MSDTASLITLRSILDLEIARSYQWDAATIIAISGVDRAGDLTTRIAEVPGSLSDIAAEGFSPHSAAGHALSHELHDAIQRRVRLWIADIPTRDLMRLRDALGADIIHEAGVARDGYTPVAMSPLKLLEHWASGSDEQREFMRVAMAGLDTLTTSSHATHASRAVGASIIERAGFLKLCRNPKFIAYEDGLVYSKDRAIPVMYVQLFLFDKICQAPADLTSLPPYVYFLMYGRHAPPGVWTAIACIFFGGIFLEVFRYRRDRAVKKGLAEQL